MRMDSRIIVALDGMEPDEIVELGSELKGKVWGFKANDLLDKMGATNCINELKRYGRVMADPKLCDTLRTVLNRLEAYNDADYVTVKMECGENTIKKATEKHDGILVVSVLTSLDNDDCEQLYGDYCREKVLEFYEMAVRIGVAGFVCSSEEVEMINDSSLPKIVPGISLTKVYEGQKRVGDPYTTIKNGAHLLVVGSAITKSDNPEELVDTINSQVNKALM